MVKETTQPEQIEEPIGAPIEVVGQPAVSPAALETLQTVSEGIDQPATDLPDTDANTNAVERPKRIEVNEDALHQLLTRMEAVEAQNKALKAEVEATADRAKLSTYRNANAPKKGRVVRLGVLADDKGKSQVVVGWLNLPNNICEKDSTGRWYEKQTRIMLMEDGTKLEGAYSDINKHMTHIEATVVGSKTEINEDGIERTIYSTVDENGIARDIDVRFVNP